VRSGSNPTVTTSASCQAWPSTSRAPAPSRAWRSPVPPTTMTLVPSTPPPPAPAPPQGLAEPGPADDHDPGPLQAVAAAEEAHRRLGRGQDLPGRRLDPQPVEPLDAQAGGPD